MTSSAALLTNLAPVTNTPASAPSSDTTNGASTGTRGDFSKPLQQARQQLARQNEPTRTPQARHAASKPASSSQTQASSDTKDDKDGDQTTAGAQGAAAAMLALLGQSVPASAAPSAVADGDDAAAAVTAAASPVAATNLTLLGAAQTAVQGKAGEAEGFTKALGDFKDKNLSVPGQGDGDADESVDATASAAATPDSKGDALANALQALTSSSSSSNQKEGSDPLEALKNLAASALQAQPQAQPNATTATTPHNLTMQSSVGSPAFGQELSQQVTWLGGQDVKEARIRLHPEDLGELDVKVSVKQDHVDVAFIAQHPQAVHAVQQTLTQLDSMLAHHGLSLGQAMVGQGNTGQGSAQAGTSGGSSSGGESGLAEVAGDVVAVAAPVVKAIGLVDMFA